MTDMLNVPKVGIGLGERTFSNSNPKIYDDLPYDVHSSESLNIFKEKLKTHISKYVFVRFVLRHVCTYIYE